MKQDSHFMFNQLQIVPITEAYFATATKSKHIFCENDVHIQLHKYFQFLNKLDTIQ